MPKSLSYLRSCGSLADWKRGNITPTFKNRTKGDLQNYRLVIHGFVSGKIMEQIPLEIMLKCMENKDVTGDRESVFTKSK